MTENKKRKFEEKKNKTKTIGIMHHLPYYYSPEQLKSYHNGILSAAAAAAAGNSSLFSIDNILAPRPMLPPRSYFPYPTLPPTPHDIFGKFYLFIFENVILIKNNFIFTMFVYAVIKT